MTMSGFLNVRKPAGLTSHQCVGAMRRVFDTRQVGHGGTLDPMATGVLTLAVGRATRFLQHLTTGKEYRGAIRLGVTTDSDDITGEVLTQKPAPWIDEEIVNSTLQRFIGEIDQVPPRVSAIKKNGVRLYKLARSKKDFKVKPRRVNIERIDVQSFTQGDFPEVDINVVCGGGTYIRSIARECGEALIVPPEYVDSTCTLRNPAGECCVGGTLTELERTRSGAFTIADSLDFDEIRSKVERGESPLQPIENMLQHLPFAELPSKTAQYWLNGGSVATPAEDIEFVGHNRFNLTSGEPIRIYSSSTMLGIAQVDPQAQHKVYVLRKRLFI
ncbi:tRNA pseudouridine(55) synthase, variant [Phytophthora nicotianae P10297]|uniref:tRNA pseudouridine(55) synthase n=2 Tax=Phytophthora nicotianae TaxID=4792 RepID=W2YDD3_PHYNI|nr:tRNA pseudouridine(55) synthase [Phytophthora nicotianae P1976]ETO63512.1 tRNA pseudouridine(55) synthase, variant [Phytophthora nicotianae P1976]ETP32746.1 tRNA pseudouridine(55) synthase [Phytophthora nicotianae P10297]ETP32747.1 tRNA pseudouridine(55) synthase, variant [Phytophthora nicotianae P10297]